jgi:hypothetical protein
MKTVIRLWGVAAVFIFCVAAFRGNVRAGGNGSKEYTITVFGGHATNAYGETITKATPGMEITVYHDAAPGKYWKSWTADVQLKENTVICQFTMPAKDVTITAETVSSQRNYTFDFTKETVKLPDEERLLILNAFMALKKTMYLDDIDLDGDGHLDIMYQKYSIGKSFSRQGLNYYSLGTSYSVNIPDGEIGALKIVVDNEKAIMPVHVANAKTYKITVEGGSSYVSETINGEKTKSSESVPGDVVYVKCNIPPEGMYVKEAIVNGVIGYEPSEYSWDNGSFYFYMPPRDVTVSFVLAEQEPLTIDMSHEWFEGGRNREYEEALRRASGCGTSTYGTGTGLDFDKDFEMDILYKNETLVSARTPYTLKNQKKVFSRVEGSPHRSKYWPVTVIFPDYENIPVTPTPTPTNKPTKAPTATPTVAPTEEQIPTPTPVVQSDKNDEKNGLSARGYALMFCAILFFIATAIVLFLLLKKEAPQPPKNPYNEWNEDRMTILPESGTVVTGNQPEQNKPPVSDVKPEDDGDNDNPGSIV